MENLSQNEAIADIAFKKLIKYKYCWDLTVT